MLSGFSPIHIRTVMIYIYESTAEKKSTQFVVKFEELYCVDEMRKSSLNYS